MNTNETMNHAAKTAQFKFGLIAPVIQGLFPDASRTAFYKRVAEKPIEFRTVLSGRSASRPWSAGSPPISAAGSMP